MDAYLMFTKRHIHEMDDSHEVYVLFVKRMISQSGYDVYMYILGNYGTNGYFFHHITHFIVIFSFIKFTYCITSYKL